MCLFAVGIGVLSGCSSVPAHPQVDRSLNEVQLSGTVTGRREVAAARRSVGVSDEWVAATSGALGLLLLHVGGTPRHYVYTVESANGSEFSVPLTAEVAAGSCFVFAVPKEKEDQFAWQLDDVRVVPDGKCATAYDVAADRRLDGNGNNALHSAIWHDQTKRALRIMEMKSVDLDGKNRFGATPLHLAVAKENVRVVQALLNAGASAEARSNDGATPVKDAEARANPEILELFKRARK